VLCDQPEQFVTREAFAFQQTRSTGLEPRALTAEDLETTLERVVDQ
jgi:hypothetical protein